MSETYFNTDEVFKIATNIESEGVEFYEKMAEATTNQKIIELFKRFALEELEHKNSFKDMFAQYGTELFDFETDNLLSQYLGEIVENGVFPTSDKFAEINSGSICDAIDLGIKAEKMSVEFYDRAAKTCINPDGKSTFEKLKCIEEEHVRQLEHLKSEVIKG